MSKQILSDGTRERIENEQPTFAVGPMAADILARNISKERPTSLPFQAAGSTKPFSGWSKCKGELDELAPIAA